MYFPFVVEKVDEMQNFEFTWPLYVFKNFPVEKFHSLKALSRVPTRINFPLGENLTKETGGFSSSISVFIQ